MPISQCHRDLFCSPTTLDELNLFQSLLDSKDLTPDLTLALINVIRAELEQPHKQSPSAYRRYSEVITTLCAQMPEIYEQVVAAWQQRRRDSSARPPGPLKPEADDQEPPPVDSK